MHQIDFFLGKIHWKTKNYALQIKVIYNLVWDKT